MSDFKSNEYAMLIGGKEFEPNEENPMFLCSSWVAYFRAARSTRSLDCYLMIHGYASEICELRESSNRSREEMAELMGLTFESYCDLEMHDNEVLECVSLAQLKKMCQAFNLSPPDFLAGNDNIAHLNFLSFDELGKLITKHIDAHDMTVPEFEDNIGWRVGSFLSSPEEGWQTNVRFLIDVCHELNIEWLSVIPA